MQVMDLLNGKSTSNVIRCLLFTEFIFMELHSQKNTTCVSVLRHTCRTIVASFLGSFGK